jgi:hypothetical protein
MCKSPTLFFGSSDAYRLLLPMAPYVEKHFFFVSLSSHWSLKYLSSFFKMIQKVIRFKVLNFILITKLIDVES